MAHFTPEQIKLLSTLATRADGVTATSIFGALCAEHRGKEDYREVMEEVYGVLHPHSPDALGSFERALKMAEEVCAIGFYDKGRNLLLEG